MSKKRGRKKRPRGGPSQEPRQQQKPDETTVDHARRKLLGMIGLGGAAVAGGVFGVRALLKDELSEEAEPSTTTQIPETPPVQIDKQPQSDKLTINPVNFPPQEHRFVDILINKKQIHKFVESVLGDFRDKRPFKLEWTTDGYSEEYDQRMQPNADAQVFKDKQLVMLNGSVFMQYRRSGMSAKDYLSYLGKRLVHELVHTYLPCQFGNEHFEEGLAVHLEWALGTRIGLNETIKEKNKPLDFKYTNRKIFAKECHFVSPFEFLSSVNYYNGAMMWEKLLEKDPDIVKKLLEEIVRRGLKGTTISKEKTIELILKINPELKGLIDSFEFLGDYKLRKPQLVAVPLDFDKSRNGLMIVLLKRDEEDCDQVIPVDYYKVRIKVNGKELSDPKVFIPPKKSELIIQEKLVGDIEISAEVKGNPNARFETELHIDNY